MYVFLFPLILYLVLKPYKKKNLQRMFRKENSVFHPWKVDTKESLSSTAHIDLESIDEKMKYLVKDHKIVSQYS